MSDSAAATLPASRAGHRASLPLLKKLHSLSGVVPVGFFLVLHLWTSSRALHGDDALRGAVVDLQSSAVLSVVEVFGIFLPLAYHALYGIYLAFQGKQSEPTYATTWLYALQRVTGFLALAFIVVHLGEFRVQRWLHGMRVEDFYQTLEEHLSSTRWGVPWMAFLYLVGIAATVFHFASGLASFGVSWGLTVTAEARRLAAVGCWGLGLGLFVLGMNTLVFFATGSRYLYSPAAPSEAESAASAFVTSSTPPPAAPAPSAAPSAH